MKPLVIDLFCGLASIKSKFLDGANSSIKEFVTRGAQHPNHMSAAVFHLSTGIHTPKLRAMRYLYNAGFTTRFTALWKVGIFPIKSLYDRAPSSSSGIVERLYVGLSAVEVSSLALARFLGALVRAISAIRCGKNNFKMRPANQAIPITPCNVGLFSSSQASSPTGAFCRTIPLIWSLSGKITLAEIA